MRTISLLLAALPTAFVVGLAPPSGDMQLQLVDGTHCLDGTRAGYYYSPASSMPETFVLYLQGGGSCTDEVSCKKRAKIALGSSSKWEDSNNGDHSPFLKTDEETNPDFHGAHHVFVAYCSGDAHRGTQNTTSSETFGLWFSGSLNFKSIVEDLKQRHKLSDATHVLLTGSSAGAVGTFNQVDRLKSYLASSVVVKAAPVSGWFMPPETGDFEGKNPNVERIGWYAPSNYSQFKTGKVQDPENATYAAYTKNLIQLYGAGYPLPACAADHPDDVFVCLTTDTYYNYISSPVFVIENRFDKYALENVLGLPTFHTFGTPQAYLRYYGRATVLSTSQVGQGSHAGDGLFLASCLDHTGNYGAKSASKTRINGTRFVDPVGDWFWERNAMPHIVADDCGDTPCNPTCDH